MKIILTRRWVFAVVLLLLLVPNLVVAQAKTYVESSDTVSKRCKGKYKGTKPSPTQLKALVVMHNEWLEIYAGHLYSFEAQSDSRQANLCQAELAGTDLRGANLQSADLSGADLTNAILIGAILRQANLGRIELKGADLSGANLEDTYLNGANLPGADLSRANLWGADLSGAYLGNADLSDAILGEVDLSGANLEGTNLSGANLEVAHLNEVVFEPKYLPDIDSISSAFNLSQMRFNLSPQALVKLRRAFKNAGYRQEERAVTFAIKTSELRKKRYSERTMLDRADRVFQYVFFELTTAWGAEPGRALLILICIIPIFAVPYVIVLHRPGRDGIWRIWGKDRMRQDLGTINPTLLRVGWWSALALGVYFSVLSAFHIGWRDLNVGNWIARMQAREYTLQASGWIRMVSAVQSIISVYLLAIWALTYFGRPFE